MSLAYTFGIALRLAVLINYYSFANNVDAQYYIRRLCFV
jgi:hypothetical protein